MKHHTHTAREEGREEGGREGRKEGGREEGRGEGGGTYYEQVRGIETHCNMVTAAAVRYAFYGVSGDSNRVSVRVRIVVSVRVRVRVRVAELVRVRVRVTIRDTDLLSIIFTTLTFNTVGAKVIVIVSTVLTRSLWCCGISDHQDPIGSQCSRSCPGLLFDSCVGGCR